MVPFEVRLDQLYIGLDHPPYMDLAHVERLYFGLRDNRPIEVIRHGLMFEIVNGRHRYVAGVLRGDTRFLVVERFMPMADTTEPLETDEVVDFPLGEACSVDNVECEACQ